MPERFSPLVALSRQLLEKRMPSLSALIARLEASEDYAYFINLVKQYVPEHEEAIMGEPSPPAQIGAFASRFEERYFPLEEPIRDGMLEDYSEITRWIPVTVLGVSYDDYHEIPSYARGGIVLMTYLIQNPWDDDTVALAEACLEHVPKELVERASKVTLTLEEAEKILVGTKYEPLAIWAERLHQNTGNFFLDSDYECLYNGGAPEWSSENVEYLTRLWKRAVAHEDKVEKFADWLEDDLPGRFDELITFIERRRNGEAEDSG